MVDFAREELVPSPSPRPCKLIPAPSQAEQFVMNLSHQVSRGSGNRYCHISGSEQGKRAGDITDRERKKPSGQVYDIYSEWGRLIVILMFWELMVVLSVNKKIAFIRILKSQNNCKDCKHCFRCMEFSLGEENPAGLSKSIALTVYFLPPTTHHWYQERTINTESRRKILQYSLLLMQGSVTAQCFSLHHQHHCHHLPSSTSPENK